MAHLWIVAIGVLAVVLLSVLLPVMFDFYRRYRGIRALRCPEAGREVEVRVDAIRVALTSALGRPRLRVKSCSLWPERKQCAQNCLTLSEADTSGGLRLQPR